MIAFSLLLLLVHYDAMFYGHFLRVSYCAVLPHVFLVFVSVICIRIIVTSQLIPHTGQ